MSFNDNGINPLVGYVCMALALAIALAPVWLTYTKHRFGVKFRAWRDSDDEFTSKAATPVSVPHTHVVDGVTIMHSHAGGDQVHEHTTVSVPMDAYIAWAKSVQN